MATEQKSPGKWTVDEIIECNGDRWKIVNIGHTNEEGKTYLHLASTTRFRKQRNGDVPVQMADWL